MNALVYIIIMSVKNRLLDILRKPGKLILYLLVIAGIVFAVINSIITQPEQGETFGSADIFWLKAVFFMLLMFFFVISILKGLKSGNVIFEMSDVNFLFTSPVMPQKILLYSVVRMLGVSFFAGLFIPFQSGALKSSFDLHPAGIFVFLAGFIAALSLMQIISLVIYSKTNGNNRRKNIVRIFAVAVFIPMAAYGTWQFVQMNGNIEAVLSAAFNSPAFSFIPVVGWVTESAVAFVTGDIYMGCVYLAVTLGAGIILLIYTFKSNHDFYEDALVSTETAFEKKRALEDGQINAITLTDRKVKVVSTGIGGIGASAIFRKHLRETFRENRFGLWGLSSLILTIFSLTFAVVMRYNGEESGVVICLAVLMWVQVFLIGTGRGLKELYSHYIYLIPESSFLKIVWSNLEVVFKVLFESIIIFVLISVIIGESLIAAAGAVAVYTAFTLLLIGMNYLSMRWTGADVTAGFLIMIYMIAVVIVMLPGVLATLYIGIAFGSTLAALGVLAVWELLAALGAFALSKSILHNCDMPVMKTM